jgi:hypothetical protein
MKSLFFSFCLFRVLIPYPRPSTRWSTTYIHDIVIVVHVVETLCRVRSKSLWFVRDGICNFFAT